MGGEEDNKESIEVYEEEDVDIASSFLDADGLPVAGLFNAMIDETTGNGEYDDSAEDLDTDADDSEAPEYETIPEMEIVLRNIDI